jgi:HK97 family phage major capsid protein
VGARRRRDHAGIAADERTERQRLRRCCVRVDPPTPKGDPIMAVSLDAARKDVREIANKILKITTDPKLSNARKVRDTSGLYAAMLKADAEVKDLEFVAARRKQIFGHDDGSDAASENGSGIGYGGQATSTIEQLAPLTLGDHEMRQLHEAVTSRKSIRLTTKAAVDGGAVVPAELRPPLTSRYEPFRIASLFPAVGMSAPVVTFMRLNGTTNPATAVAQGGLKPDLGLASEVIELRAVKIAGLIQTFDESLADYAEWAGIISQELTAAIVHAENAQLLSGSGVAPNMVGLLATSGILTHPKGTDTALDALEIAVETLRTGPAFADADTVLMHPSDWSAIRRAKASGSGQYLAVDPLTGKANSLWGIPVATTTDIAAGKAVVGAFGLGGQVYVREGVHIDSGFNADDFAHNMTTLRGEQRLALAVTRPAAFVLVTGLAA